MLKVLDKSLVERVTGEAELSPRKRAITRFNEDCDYVQRMVNVFCAGTYVCPHKHEDPDKVELFVALKGRGIVFTFDDAGQVLEHHVLSPEENWGVEIAPGTWHMVAALDPVTAFFEIIEGPYDPQTHKNFAPWAPREGSSEAAAYLQQLLASV